MSPWGNTPTRSKRLNTQQKRRFRHTWLLAKVHKICTLMTDLRAEQLASRVNENFRVFSSNSHLLDSLKEMRGRRFALVRFVLIRRARGANSAVMESSSRLLKVSLAVSPGFILSTRSTRTI